MDVDAYLEEQRERVDRFLDAALPAASEPPRELHAAMRHLVFPAGKRVRPALAFAACEAVGSPPERALPAAAAVELVHTYSLIHDDLPCMDDDAERRGRPSVHVAFGEALAVLAGDALLAHAFGLLAAPDAGIHAAGALAAVRELAEAAGSRRLVGGQADDLAFREGDAASVESVHRRKTAALMAAAVLLGARYGGADERRIGALQRFGEAVGMVFQIADDLLDRDGEDPCSLVRVLGAEGARARAEALLRAALAELEAWGERAEPLRELARFAARRKR